MDISALPLTQVAPTLAPFYSAFRVHERHLLTGHSHQAWPDCTLAAQTQAWHDAATLVDDKWEVAFKKAERFRAGLARMLDDTTGYFALGQNTHELVTRLLSALPLNSRRRIVTSDAEFHSLRRQLHRLREVGVDVISVPADPVETLSERMAARVTDTTAVAIVSNVLYNSARIVPNMRALLEVCQSRGAELLIDVYHCVNVVPFSVDREGLGAAFLVGGGYKYLQMGEGNCFLRFPKTCTLRPILTGWFAEFDLIEHPNDAGEVRYPDGPARFAGATYDPVSHYRAAAVLDYLLEVNLNPEFLRKLSQHQIHRLAKLFDDLDAPPHVISRDRDVDLAQIGGFLALRSPYAEQITTALRQRGVYIDRRNESVRLGPAPYVTDEQMSEAIDALAEVLRDDLAF